MKLPKTPSSSPAATAALATDLLASLSALSTSISIVQFSRGRWSTIQSTVDRLSFSLSSLSLASPLVASLLSSLSQTLTLAIPLASDCQRSNPTNGKLRTNSDIAAAASSLDRLSADLDLVINSPDLLEDSGVKNLVARLRIGCPQSRTAALDSLINEGDENLKLAIDSNAVGAIVRLMDSPETREKAAAAVARVSAVEGCRDALLTEKDSILNRLVRILESQSEFSKETACFALKNLTLVKENAILIGSRGGIGTLLEICRSGTPSAVAEAAGVLRNLAAVRELQQKFLEEGAVSVLIGVLKSGTVMARENSMGCFCNLAVAHDELSIKVAIFKEGVLDCVMDYMDGNRNLQPAIGLLRNLGFVKYIADIIQSSELWVRVILALDNSDSGTRIEAAKAISEFNGKSVKETGDAVPTLVRMLDAKGPQEKDAAMKALASILKFSSKMRRVFRKEEKGVVNAVMLLDPFTRGVEKKYVVEVLLLVSQSKKCRRLMVACGACEFLKRLVGMEVEGAKRLLECLERGKIWGVFPRS